MLTQRLTEDYVYMISTAPGTQNDTMYHYRIRITISIAEHIPKFHLAIFL